MKLLLFGPRYHRTGQVGGVVVLFEMLLEDLDRLKIDYFVVDTNKKNYNNYLSAILYIFWYVFRLVPRASHVSLHGTAKDYVFIAPFVVWLSRIFAKPISLRKFAGSFREVYKISNPASKFLIRYVVKRASVNFFETRYLVDFFSVFNPNTFWMPNARSRSAMQRIDRPFGGRFVFLGHVRREKGILELIEAANQLPDEYSVDIYGQMVDPGLEEQIANSRANYKGMLKPDEVAKVLADYDVLVLPTFWSGEGYPGVIIEAFSVGIPVVTTALEGIKEIVAHGKNGFLIEPKNAEHLVKAMLAFNNENYRQFTVSAKRSFEQFECKSVTKIFLWESLL